MTGSDYSILHKKSPNNAHRALFDEYCAYVYTIVHNRLRSIASKEDIEECVSDIFADVYAKLDTENNNPGEIKPFICTVAKRRAVDKFRRCSAKKIETVSLFDSGSELLADESSLAEETERKELQKAVFDQIKALGEPDSTIIIQKYYYDRSSKEIAAQLSMTSVAVRSRCSRALKKLKQSLVESGITL